MSVSARMKINQIIETTYSPAIDPVTQVVFNAVTTSDPNNPNYSFSKATPSAELRMTVTNPDALAQFVIGKTFDLTFTESEIQ